MTPASPSPSTEASDLSPSHPTRRPSLRIALLAALVVAVLGLAAVRLELFDPYRPGTTHRVEVTFHAPCLNPADLLMDGRAWSSDDLVADVWVVDGTGTVTGTLEVVERNQGVFTADGGGSIGFVRHPGSFGAFECLVR